MTKNKTLTRSFFTSKVRNLGIPALVAGMLAISFPAPNALAEVPDADGTWGSCVPKPDIGTGFLDDWCSCQGTPQDPYLGDPRAVPCSYTGANGSLVNGEKICRMETTVIVYSAWGWFCPDCGPDDYKFKDICGSCGASVVNSEGVAASVWEAWSAVLDAAMAELAQ
tara:strand:- start:1667 stop:2167 length:501 start_codon:yes stop_codon:yes gene_type:complete